MNLTSKADIPNLAALFPFILLAYLNQFYIFAAQQNDSKFKT
jgi:hypothetical protein